MDKLLSTEIRISVVGEEKKQLCMIQASCPSELLNFADHLLLLPEKGGVIPGNFYVTGLPHQEGVFIGFAVPSGWHRIAYMIEKAALEGCSKVVIVWDWPNITYKEFAETATQLLGRELKMLLHS